MAKIEHFDAAIVGSGIVGLSAALGAAQRNLQTVLIAPEKGEPDGKTSALLGESVDILKSLDVGEDIRPISFPLKTMRIIDGTRRLIRAPQTDFTASEIGLEAFGYNIENRLLATVLEQHISRFANIDRQLASLATIETGNISGETGPARLTTSDGITITADLVIAADGRNSMVRKSLAIGEHTWKYPQTALVANFAHTLPHHDISTEFHTETGPFALVPLGYNRSSLVCVVDDAGAQKLPALEGDALNLEMERRMHSILGKVSLESRLKGFPLSGMVAKHFSSGPVMLAGEAAHAFPPIGAQGLNLGLRDIKAALDLLSSHGTITSQAIAERYGRMRTGDILSRTASVDLLNRSLLTGFLPVQAGRSLGLYAMNTVGPLRRLMMREGMAPGSSRQNPFEAVASRLKSSR